jgi:hypothetical protein
LCSHKQKENETSKLATPFSQGAEAETQTAGTPTGKGTTQSLQEKALFGVFFYK